MPRQSDITPEQIEAINANQFDEYKKAEGRKAGFQLMDVRDRGWGRLSNGVTVEWPVPEDRREEGVAYSDLPPGTVVLHTGSQHIVLNVDELQRFLRWA